MFKKLKKRVVSKDVEETLQEEPENETGKMIVDLLKNKYGVKMLAFDFDETLVDISVVPYAGDADDLAANHFRPCFRSIMASALKAGMFCCVVSYNVDRDIIAKTVEKALPDKKAAKNVLVISSGWSDSQAGDAIHKYGKEQHLDLAKEQYLKSTGHELQPLEIFLFDDNRLNVSKAISSGHHGYLVKKTITLEEVRDFLLKYLSKAGQPSTNQNAANVMTSVLAITPSNTEAKVFALPAYPPPFPQMYATPHPQMYPPLAGGQNPYPSAPLYGAMPMFSAPISDIGTVLSFSVGAN